MSDVTKHFPEIQKKHIIYR